MLNGRKYPDLVLASTIEPKEINWLWYPYVPAGSASMLFGPGGTGKSHIAVDIAARISRGELLPNQNVALPAQNVLMMSAEDEFDRVLVPRLIKSGADLTKIAFPAKPFTLDRDGLKMVEQYMTSFAAGIVFIDPIVAYIGGKVDINRANETREFTGGLHQMAMRTGSAIIVVHHSRKGSDGMDYEKMMGSADFNNAVRSVLYTTQAPNGDRIMRHVKANYAPLGPTIGYDFGEKGFVWTGVYHEDGVKAKMGAPNVKRNETAEWVKDFLAKGPRRAVDVEREAGKKGFTHRTLVRAKAGVAESYLISVDGKMQWYWRLLETGDDKADVPVMDGKWGPERQDRTEREVVARTNERTGGTNGPVGAGGSGDQLDQWTKELLG